MCIRDSHLTPELRTEIIRSKTPIVLAGTMDAEHEIASVNIDYKEATQEAVETLIENGHKKVAFVTAALKNICLLYTSCSTWALRICEHRS